ncbi:zinc finger protein ZAT5-like [Phalaenopsis equestris]|uniref:zinc finger protein ZAT5-like n=1 Tax=Phalaenopsis equestris TaxID=78828 RepID=UPI0009E4B219|nr:zinc finger protein ZAT5-like [Phalaenopsis equestris]
MPMNTDKKQKQGGKQVGKNKNHSHVCKQEFSCRRRLRLPMRAHGINYQHISDAEENPNDHVHHQQQSPTSHSNTAEEEDVAHCLVMLSSATVGRVLLIGNGERASTFSRKEDVNDEEILPLPLVATISRGPNLNPTLPRRTFPCGWCEKVFPSHQALGGHRASHKKVKGCFAAKLGIKSPDDTKAYIEDDNRNANHQNNMIESFVLAENWPRQFPKKKNPKAHVCLECNRQFSSGQALGGHKRSHSAAAAAAAATVNPMFAATATTDMEVATSSSITNVMQPHTLNLLRMFSDSTSIIDLNMPVPTDNITESPPQSGWEMNQTRKNQRAATTSDNDDEKEKAPMENLEEEVESKEVNMANPSDLMVDTDEEDGSSEWLQIGFGSMFHKQSGADRS